MRIDIPQVRNFQVSWCDLPFVLFCAVKLTRLEASVCMLSILARARGDQRGGLRLGYCRDINWMEYVLVRVYFFGECGETAVVRLDVVQQLSCHVMSSHVKS